MKPKTFLRRRVSTNQPLVYLLQHNTMVATAQLAEANSQAAVYLSPGESLNSSRLLLVFEVV